MGIVLLLFNGWKKLGGGSGIAFPSGFILDSLEELLQHP